MNVVKRDGFVRNAIVQRNPTDWTWGEQDGGNGKQGRLISIDDDMWARVTWDNGISNSFRAGANGKFDLVYSHNPPRQHGGTAPAAAAPPKSPAAPQPKPAPKPASPPVAPPPAEARPGEKVSRANFVAGMSVVPSNEWKWGAQHGGKTGKLISIDSSDWVKVDFGGKINSYRAGTGPGGFDLVYGSVDPAPTKPAEPPKPPTTETTENPDQQCIVCFANKKDHIAVPCGHLALCGTCCEDLKKRRNSRDVKQGCLANCVVCREGVTMFMKVYQ
jgi:hypothetical protein